VDRRGKIRGEARNYDPYSRFGEIMLYEIDTKDENSLLPISKVVILVILPLDVSEALPMDPPNFTPNPVGILAWEIVPPFLS